MPDRYVEGECYICHYPEARGDQCDNCGNLLDATKLINPHSKNHPEETLIIRETEHYFLDLAKFSDALLDYLKEHENHWRPNVVRFSQNFINEGLRGRPITRDIDWGIPVPLEGWDGKRLYVWFEAVMGYLTASIEWAKNSGAAGALERLVVQPGSRDLQLHRQGQHPLPHDHLAGRTAGHRRHLQTPISRTSTSTCPTTCPPTSS